MIASTVHGPVDSFDLGTLVVSELFFVAIGRAQELFVSPTDTLMLSVSVLSFSAVWPTFHVHTKKSAFRS